MDGWVDVEKEGDMRLERYMYGEEKSRMWRDREE